MGGERLVRSDGIKTYDNSMQLMNGESPSALFQHYESMHPTCCVVNITCSLVSQDMKSPSYTSDGTPTYKCKALSGNPIILLAPKGRPEPTLDSVPIDAQKVQYMGRLGASLGGPFHLKVHSHGCE